MGDKRPERLNYLLLVVDIANEGDKIEFSVERKYQGGTYTLRFKNPRQADEINNSFARIIFDVEWDGIINPNGNKKDRVDIRSYFKPNDTVVVNDYYNNRAGYNLPSPLSLIEVETYKEEVFPNTDFLGYWYYNFEKGINVNDGTIEESFIEAVRSRQPQKYIDFFDFLFRVNEYSGEGYYQLYQNVDKVIYDNVVKKTDFQIARDEKEQLITDIDLLKKKLDRYIADELELRKVIVKQRSKKKQLELFELVEDLLTIVIPSVLKEIDDKEKELEIAENKYQEAKKAKEALEKEEREKKWAEDRKRAEEYKKKQQEYKEEMDREKKAREQRALEGKETWEDLRRRENKRIMDLQEKVAQDDRNIRRDNERGEKPFDWAMKQYQERKKQLEDMKSAYREKYMVETTKYKENPTWRVKTDEEYQAGKKEGEGINNPDLYEKAKEIVYKQYPKHSAYRSGQLVKKYKELGGTYSGKKPTKTGIARWFKEEWADIGNKEYPVYRPTKRVSKETPLTVSEIDPVQAKKQIALKQKIKGTSNLPAFQKAGGSIEQFSNPKKVQENAKKYLGKDAVVYLSTKKEKKYMIKDPNDKWVHFGQMDYEDFTKHQDEKRRKNYLTRTANIKGDWKSNKYSPNNLSRNLLW